ncbi:MAG: ribosomal protein L13e [Thaumarchaeota archaeon]|nr:ribosomal protein L13e [Nitrososphaerota archaeon]
MTVGIAPIVRRKLKDGRIITRTGRGFSLNELRAAGITIDVAKRLGIPIDKRRRSSREENIQMLKEFLQKISKE